MEAGDHQVVLWQSSLILPINAVKNKNINKSYKKESALQPFFHYSNNIFPKFSFSISHKNIGLFDSNMNVKAI